MLAFLPPPLPLFLASAAVSRIGGRSALRKFLLPPTRSARLTIHWLRTAKRTLVKPNHQCAMVRMLANMVHAIRLFCSCEEASEGFFRIRIKQLAFLVSMTFHSVITFPLRGVVAEFMTFREENNFEVQHKYHSLTHLSKKRVPPDTPNALIVTQSSERPKEILKGLGCASFGRNISAETHLPIQPTALSVVH